MEGHLYSWDDETQTNVRMFFSISGLHSYMKIPVYHSAFLYIFVNMREQMLCTVFLFISCFHSEIRLQQVAFSGATPSKKSIFLNLKFCNNMLPIIPGSSLCFSYLSVFLPNNYRHNMYII